MQQNFTTALGYVLQSEGGWEDNSADPGGVTMFGVTLDEYQAYKANPHLTAVNLRNITMPEVKDLYRKNYWNVCSCDLLPGGIDYLVFDFGVNAGCGRSIKILQQVIGATIDGSLGPKTLDLVLSTDPTILMQQFTHAKEDYYKTLNNPTFEAGWLNRVAQAKINAAEMMG